MIVFVGESSYVIRKGVVHLLSGFTEIDTVHEFESPNDMEESLFRIKPDMLILNTSFHPEGMDSWDFEKGKSPLVLYLFNAPLPLDASKSHLSLMDGKSSMVRKISLAIDACQSKNKELQGEDLSQREKLVLKHVALGATNKEIADKLFISTHTVITHRKNITRKLGIKTVSGLTVYAILNHLVNMEDMSV